MRRNLSELRAGLLSLALCGLIAGSAFAAPAKGRIVKVVDGDTLVVDTGDSKERIRLIGIDTPEKEINEKAQRDSERTGRDVAAIVTQGNRSFEFVKGLLPKGAPVKLEQDVESKDKYGRSLAYVYLEDGRMLNEVIVAEGFATPYSKPPNVRYASKFLTAAQSARAQLKGLWRDGGMEVSTAHPKGKKKHAAHAQ